MLITLSDATRLVPAATFCDSGADTRRGRTKPTAWISVSIRAVGMCTPDDNGRMLHAVMRFFIPGTQETGKRRRIVGKYTPEGVAVNETIDIAFDHGTGWIGSKASLFLRGGTNGDVYDVIIAESVPRDETDPDRVIDVYEDPFRFRLTSYFSVPDVDEHFTFVDFPTAPDYHQWFQVIEGTAELVMPAGVRLPLSSRSKKVPLSAPQIRVSSGIYVTKGEI